VLATFQRGYVEDVGKSHWDLFVGQPDGESIRLTDGPYNSIHPRLHPALRSIVYASDRDGDYELYTMSLADLTCTPGVHPGCSPNEVLDYGHSASWLIADRNDNVHLFGRTPFSQLYYQHRAADGSWQWPAVIPDMPASIVALAVDDAGVLSLLWAEHPQGYAYPLHFFRQRKTDGGWSDAEAIGPGAHPTLVVDSQGQAHLLYTDRTILQREEYQLLYRTRSADGVWSAAELITTIHDSRLDSALAVLGDGTAYTFWVQRDSSGETHPALVYRIRRPAGGWSPIRTVADDTTIESLSARRTRDDGLHLVWLGNGSTFYSTLPLGGNWSAPEALGVPAWAFLVDDADTLYIVNSGHAPSEAMDYRAKAAGGAWGELRRAGFGTDYALPAIITVGAANSFHALWQTRFDHFSHEYHPPQWITQTGESLLSQTVSIPADLHRPTLAYLYTFEGGTTGDSYFAVTVSDGVTDTELLRTTEIAPSWRQAWADMERWAGQTVTVTFGVYQAAEDTAVRVLLDQVSLGAWKTPIVQEVYPTHVEAGVATTLIITGENFLATPAVRVGDQLLTTVQLVNDRRLEAALPGAFPAGLYSLEVVNPGGESFLRPTALAIGRLVWLPIIDR
jgi:hypothetical protein